ncbi:ATP-dependent helicase [Kribbella sandramycini]|uniref:DNA 3'-5' helicase n=1 Tax=Kribbella sandramycini TaxID=60450 RepID=A0A7Y4L518_9ACTN|nr:ATP-dependent DNA helicase [Kribbella sandramycini]MBB6571275.1 DNA helicase-2/ATP-dependent DNA helicase PcrA [Kribbella sandramycini]NOL43321.1 ATP-dependent helicase [Kribbella sandramycini]
MSAVKLRTTSELCELLGVPFSEQQLAAITAPLAPGVIVAGAGSGKTTAMAARVVWLICTGQVQPEEVLGLTFTKKAANELDVRIREDLTKAGVLGSTLPPDQHPILAAHLRSNVPNWEPEEPGEPVVSTYHAFAGTLITEHGLRLGLEPDARVLADATRFQLAGRVVRRSSGPIRFASHHVPTLVNSLLSLDGELADHLLKADAVRDHDDAVRSEVAAARKQTVEVRKLAETALKRGEILQLVEEYQAYKAERGVVDFADQMALGARLAEECPEVAVAERARYKVVLLDEYQDTSVSQRRMLTALFAGPDGRGHPVTAVGDPCQAIYGWRGASVANLDEFPEHFPNADGSPARRYVLSVNRRCGSRILAAANQHAAELYEQHPGVIPLEAPADAPEGAITVGLFETRSQEIEWVADAIVAAHQNRGRRWKDIGILMRTNVDLSAVHEALISRKVPVEVVGLGGLLALPEVVDVVATLQAVNDLTANAAMLRILTGPRYRIGHRDLALLANRSRALADTGARPAVDDLVAALDAAVAGMDSTEVISLAEAVDDPGSEAWGYAPEALSRFKEISTELRELRAHAGEPLLDLVRRVIATIGLDIELTATPDHIDSGRRDHLAAFLDAVGNFVSTESDGSLDGLLAYLAAEEEYAAGLDLAVPSEADSVKLLTTHRSKGLEWPIVFVPTLVQKVFPSDRGRDKWTTNAKVLPWPLRGDADTLPDFHDLSNAGLKAFADECKEVNSLEERRLGYVAFTRAKELLVATGHWWGPTQKRPRGPSSYLETLKKHAGERVIAWADQPELSEENPELAEQTTAAWPAAYDADAYRRRLDAAELVQRARAEGPSAAAEESLLLDEQALVARWDSELERLLSEARESRSRKAYDVTLPAALSATQVMRLAKDPDGLASELARPMPRKPNRAARFGTRFHAWVESYFGQQLLIDPDDLPGAADEDIVDDTDLTELMEAFRTGPYGETTPYEIEAPFALSLDTRTIRGRIDAVYQVVRPDGSRGYDVVDWKTSRSESADPLQLAIYRLAWSELMNIPLTQVGAAFYYVRTAEIVRPEHLPAKRQLIELLNG